MLSEHTSFVTERITDILKFEREKEVKFSDDVKMGIIELQNELSRICVYFKYVEQAYDDKRVLSDLDRNSYFNFSSIVHSSDDILDRLMSSYESFDQHSNFSRICVYLCCNVVSYVEPVGVARGIRDLVKTIQNSCNSLSPQINYIFNTGGNTNHPYSTQIIGTNIYFNHSGPSHMKPDTRPKSYGHVPNPHLVGFKSEIQILLHRLLQPHDTTHVVGIVGIGGSGKTTLAKHIYHHSDINSYFAFKVWVCISQSWDKISILNAIWRQATKRPRAREMGEAQVIDCLSKLLCSKSYLVVLDDIWDISAWNDICPALPKGNGSKVVITTRNQILPQDINPNVVIVKPKPLKDEESYELFKRITSPSNESIPEDMLQLGMQMVKKCNGLPLAIIALAGVLRKDKSQRSWERITKKILYIENESTQGVVKEILALSYYELPHHLKLCALYLHVFPEDYEIKAQKLIQMWIAESFMEEESVAEEYLDELAQRCIVEVVKKNSEGQVCRVQVHDLIRTMLIDIDEERCSFTNPVLRLVPRTTLYGDEQKSDESRKEVLVRYLHGSSHVRSLIFLNFPNLEKLSFPPLFIKLKLLRVLVLSDPWNINFNGLPEEIGNLIHLRYLEICGGQCHFPASIGKLENLRTLDLGYHDAPSSQINLEKLKELRHLYLPTGGLPPGDMKVMGLQKMKKLKILSAKGDEWILSVMPQLNDFLQELYVTLIKKKEYLEAVFTTPSITSNNLHTLSLEWCGGFRNCLCDMSILSKCTNLKKLMINGEINRGTPIMLPPNLILLGMRSTCITDKQVLNKISELCPYLKILRCEHAFWVTDWHEKELVCNKNSFPQLEKLVLLGRSSDPALLIIERGAMPRLSHLVIDNHVLDFNDEGWERVPHIPKLTFFKFRDYETPLEEKLKQCRKDWNHCINDPAEYSETDF